MASTDEERWLEAELQIAPQLSPERRRASRRAWLLVIVAAVVYGALTSIIRVLLFHHSTPASKDHPALSAIFWIGLAMAGAGVLVVLAALVVGLATKRLRLTWERVDGALSRAQNRTVRRQIRGREPVDPRRRTIVRAVAQQDVRIAAALIPCYIGFALAAIGLMVMLDRPDVTAVLAGLLVLFTAIAAWQYWSIVPAARRHLAST